MPVPPVTDWRRGSLGRVGTHVTELNRAVRQIAAESASPTYTDRTRRFEMWPGKIDTTDAGGVGPTYQVVRQCYSGQSSTGLADDHLLDDAHLNVSVDNNGQTVVKGKPVTVLNIAEIADNTHNLKVSAYVWVYALWDRYYADVPLKRYVMSEGGASTCAPATDPDKTLGDGTLGTLAADTNDWPVPYNGLLNLWVQSRTFWDQDAGVLYAYMRKIVIDNCGVMQSVSAETRVAISTYLCNG